MRYLSVCSGIASETVAWHALGWECVGFSEVDPQCNAVLAKRFPGVKNYGSIIGLSERYDGPRFDLLVGGTPCQSFSVAGLRGGLDDDRGKLVWEFLAIAKSLRPRWLVWENVPGVTSATSHVAPDLDVDNVSVDRIDRCEDGIEVVTTQQYDADEDHAFACFLAALSELGYGFAYRTLDAQYVRVESHPRAVPQRRRRVFVVGYLGDWRPPVGLLLEPESLSRDPAPSRKTGAQVAGTIGSRSTKGGGLGTDFETDGGVVAFGRNNTSGPIDTAGCLNAHQIRQDFESETLITQPIAPTLRAMPHDKSHANAGGQVAVAIQERADRTDQNGSGFSEDGAAYTLESRPTPQAVAFDARQSEVLVYGDKSGPIDTGAPPIGVMAIRGRGGENRLEVRYDGSANAVVTPNGGRAGINVGAIHDDMVVRRITPLEAERLQGFPDGWTLVEYNGKPMADGPRYRMIGNAMAVNVMSWLGERFDLWERICGKED